MEPRRPRGVAPSPSRLFTEQTMRSVLLWALGVPIPIIILIWLLY